MEDKPPEFLLFVLTVEESFVNCCCVPSDGILDTWIPFVFHDVKLSIDVVFRKCAKDLGYI